MRRRTLGLTKFEKFIGGISLEENDDKKKIHALRRELYVKEKEEIITIKFLVSVPHPKWGTIVWTCVKDHIIDEKEAYKDIGLRGF